CPLMAITPLVTVHTWRSCTDATPGTVAIQSCTSDSAMWAGAASSRMSVLSFTNRHALASINTEMKIEISGSAATQPVVKIMTPATGAERAEGIAQHMQIGAPLVE